MEEGQHTLSLSGVVYLKMIGHIVVLWVQSFFSNQLRNYQKKDELAMSTDEAGIVFLRPEIMLQTRGKIGSGRKWPSNPSLWAPQSHKITKPGHWELGLSNGLTCLRWTLKPDPLEIARKWKRHCKGTDDFPLSYRGIYGNSNQNNPYDIILPVTHLSGQLSTINKTAN